MANAGGGIKNAVKTGVVLIIIISAIIAWARVNNISGPESVYNYFKAWSDKIWSCGWGELKWECSNPIDPSDPVQRGDSNVIKNADQDTSTDGNQKDGASQDKMILLSALEKIKTADPVDVEYDRADWKHWTGSPCDTRDEVLIRDGKNVVVDKSSGSCKIVSGEWVSPYDGVVLTSSRGVDIDHVIPLGYAAKHGGQEWSADKKEAFANDKSQLLSTSAASNRGKSDSGPGEYMPRREFQCEYSKLWVNTAAKYGISLSERDKFVLKDGLQKC